MLDPKIIKKDFPILSRTINGMPIIYLDNAATTHKPVQVVNAIFDYYFNYNANVSRGIYTLAEESTAKYENARANIARFLNVSAKEIIFTSNSTFSLNVAVFGYIANIVNEGDLCVSLISEHHSSLVPLQQVAQAKNAKLEFLDLNNGFEFPYEKFENSLKNKNVKVLSVTHVSNVLGTKFDIRAICDLAHKYGCLVLVDGSQAVGHLKLNLPSLGCDFYAFSGHKMLGPMGIGVLYARANLLEKMSPMFFGGGMIQRVSEINSTFKVAPERMEPGTPNVEGAVGLSAAVDYLEKIGMENITRHEELLTKTAMEKLNEIDRVKIVGTDNAQDRTGIVSFVLEGIHSHDVAAVLNSQNICVRSGQHCTMPLHNKLNISSSIRASFYIYNELAEIDKLVEGLKYAIKILSK